MFRFQRPLFSQVRVTSNPGVKTFTSRAGVPGKVMNVDLQVPT
jgi:hypothetical protein